MTDDNLVINLSRKARRMLATGRFPENTTDPTGKLVLLVVSKCGGRMKYQNAIELVIEASERCGGPEQAIEAILAGVVTLDPHSEH